MSSFPAKVSGPDRRLAVRYAATPDGFSTENTCQPIADEPDEIWFAVVRDISTGGLGLVVGRRFEPGTVLLVHLQDANRTTKRALLVRVAHAVREMEDAWFLGCSFPNPLSEAELLSIL